MDFKLHSIKFSKSTKKNNFEETEGGERRRAKWVKGPRKEVNVSSRLCPF